MWACVGVAVELVWGSSTYGGGGRGGRGGGDEDDGQRQDKLDSQKEAMKSSDSHITKQNHSAAKEKASWIPQDY